MVIHKKIAKTEQKIKSAFIYLVEKNGLEHLTVNNILKYAHINRSTFYAHYANKFELIDFYESEVLQNINRIAHQNLMETMKLDTSETPIYPIFIKLLNYINSEFDLVKVLLGPNGDPKIETTAKALIMDIIDEDLYRVKGTNKMTTKIPNDYAHELVLSSLFDIIKFWLTRDNPETPDEIAKIIMQTRYLSAHDLLGLNEK